MKEYSFIDLDNQDFIYSYGSIMKVKAESFGKASQKIDKFLRAEYDVKKGHRPPSYRVICWSNLEIY